MKMFFGKRDCYKGCHRRKYQRLNKIYRFYKTGVCELLKKKEDDVKTLIIKKHIKSNLL